MATARSSQTIAKAIYLLAIVTLFIALLRPGPAKAQDGGITKLFFYYSHLDFYSVTPGQWVDVGQSVGGAGDSGFMRVKNIHVHLAVGIYPPDVEAQRINQGISQTSDWVDPDWVLKILGYSMQPGISHCGAGFGKNNPAGGQTFHNAVDLCGWSRGEPVLAVVPGTVCSTAWFPPSSESRDSGHGRVSCVEVTLAQPIYPDTQNAEIIEHYDTRDEEISYQESSFPPPDEPVDWGSATTDAPDAVVEPAVNFPVGAFAFALAALVLLLLPFRQAKGYRPILLTFSILLIGIGSVTSLVGPGTQRMATAPTAEITVPATPTAGIGEIVPPTPAPTQTPAPTPASGGSSQTLRWNAVCPPGLAPFFCEVPVGAIWGENIMHWSSLAGITPNQSATVMLIESCGYYNAESTAGALGLYQLWPPSFPEYTREELLDPDTNGKIGNQYYAGVLAASGGNIYAAGARYNGGPAAGAWILNEITRQDYKDVLMGPKLWWSETVAERKAKEVEKFVEFMAIADQADGGDRSGFDAYLATGRCTGAVRYYNSLIPTPTPVP